MTTLGNPLLLGDDGGFSVSRSLRLRSSASAYLNRTFTSSATWTVSIWTKRGALGVVSPLFDGIKFNANDTLTAGSLTTTAVYRDPSAWYHIVVSSSNAYVNGVSVGSLTASALSSPRIGSDGTNYFDGYMAEVVFIDGQALAPTAFGAFSPYNQWLPKKYAGTYGTNGFYLPFTNNASAATLGNDFSGNSNTWTTNNISVTTGSSYDSTTDVPTLTSATAANFATWSPIDKSPNTTTSQANLSATNANATYQSIRSTIGVTSGKWYWEIQSGDSVGIATQQSNLSSTNDFLPNGGTAWAYITNGNKSNAGTSTAYGATYTSSNVIGVAFDADAGSLTFYKDGTSQGVAYSTGLTGQIYFAWCSLYNGSTGVINFGQQPFTYTPPTGYLALNTFNLASGAVTTSGTFTGNASADGPFVYLNGIPTAMTINGNAVTFGTNADKLANGFKVRSSSASYNTAGTNTYSVSTFGTTFKYANAQGNP